MAAVPAAILSLQDSLAAIAKTNDWIELAATAPSALISVATLPAVTPPEEDLPAPSLAANLSASKVTPRTASTADKVVPRATQDQHPLAETATVQEDNSQEVVAPLLPATTTKPRSATPLATTGATSTIAAALETAIPLLRDEITTRNVDVARLETTATSVNPNFAKSAAIPPSPIVSLTIPRPSAIPMLSQGVIAQLAEEIMLKPPLASAFTLRTKTDEETETRPPGHMTQLARTDLTVVAAPHAVTILTAIAAANNATTAALAATDPRRGHHV